MKVAGLNVEHPQTGGAGVSKDALRNKRRVVKLVTIVTVMFALSWLPIQVIIVTLARLLSSEKSKITEKNIFMLSVMLCFFST